MERKEHIQSGKMRMRQIIFEVIIFLFVCFGALAATIGLSGCTRETVIYRPVQMSLSDENRESIEKMFQAVKNYEAELKRIEAGNESVVSEMNHSYLIEKRYFEAFLKKDFELARLAMTFRAVLDEFFEKTKN